MDVTQDPRTSQTTVHIRTNSLIYGKILYAGKSGKVKFQLSLPDNMCLTKATTGSVHFSREVNTECSKYRDLVVTALCSYCLCIPYAVKYVCSWIRSIHSHSYTSHIFIVCLAPQREFAGLSLRWIPTSGLAWSLYKCATLWRAIYGFSATEKKT